jgi:putative ABC transport system permease protein
MPLLRIAWRNIGRNKRRSLLSALAVAFAVAVLTFAMALQQGSYADMIYQTVHARTGHLQVQHPDYWPDADLTKRLKQPGEILNALEAMPAVLASAPRIQAAALVGTEENTFGALIQGIDPARERETSTLANMVREGKFLETNDRDGALLGAGLAKNLGVELGDEIVFIGQGADGSLAAGRLIVRGITRMGIAELDRTAVTAHVDRIGEAYSMRGAVTEIAVLLQGNEEQDAAESGIEATLQAMGVGSDARVVPWTTLMPGIEQSIKLDWYSGQIIYFVLVLVVGFGIANTFLMAYLERLRELGVILALGMRPRGVALMVYAESVFLTLMGVLAGLAIGIPVVQFFHRKGIYFGKEAEEIMAEYGMSATIHPALSPLVIRLAVLIVGGVALVLALYPACKASRLAPLDGMRRG